MAYPSDVILFVTGVYLEHSAIYSKRLQGIGKKTEIDLCAGYLKYNDN
jgi:hypothetical protein